jgi:hypothetical protein
VAQGGQQSDVFEHIRMVAGMESVSITEHAPMVTNKPHKSLIFCIMEGFAALCGPAAKMPRFFKIWANCHLRGSQQRNTDRGKGPDKPFFKEKTHDYNFQRQTR